VAKRPPSYPFGYPRVVSEEPVGGLDALQLYELYDFHVRKAEHAKQVCDDIIDYHDDRARWEVATGSTTLPYEASILGERYVANDLVFGKWSAKYRWHSTRAQYLGQRLIMAQNERIIKLLEARS
jgi:hypothetical protein